MAGPAVPIRAYARIRGHQAAPVPARNSIKILTRRNGGPRRARGSRSADGGTGSPWSSVVLRVKSFLCCPRARHCQVPTGCRSSAHSNFYSPHALRLLQLDQAAADFSAALGHDLDIGRVAPAHRARHRRRVLHETRQHLQPRQKPADGTFPLDRKGERSMHLYGPIRRRIRGDTAPCQTQGAAKPHASVQRRPPQVRPGACAGQFPHGATLSLAPRNETFVRRHRLPDARHGAPHRTCTPPPAIDAASRQCQTPPA